MITPVATMTRQKKRTDPRREDLESTFCCKTNSSIGCTSQTNAILWVAGQSFQYSVYCGNCRNDPIMNIAPEDQQSTTQDFYETITAMMSFGVEFSGQYQVVQEASQVVSQ